MPTNGTPNAHFGRPSVSPTSLDKYYKSIRLVDVNGDRRADACGRGINGIQCALAQPYYPPLMFSVAQSWLPWFGDNPFGTSESYWGTVQPADVDAKALLACAAIVTSALAWLATVILACVA
jgi:hypothetical protein